MREPSGGYTYLAFLRDFWIEKSDFIVELGHLFMSQWSEVGDRAKDEEQVSESRDSDVVGRHVQRGGA